MPVRAYKYNICGKSCEDTSKVPKMIKITILEDDAASREFAAELLRRTDYDFEIFECERTDELDYTDMSDAYLLDVELANGNTGVDAAKEIRSCFGDAPHIIFLTAHDKYMLDAFDAGAFNYILKPIDEARFFEVINRAVDRIKRRKNNSKHMITVKCKGVVQTVDPQNVCYIESANHKVIFYTPERTFSGYGKMSDLEGSLGNDFFRVHRGYLVNLAYVDGYSNSELWLKNGSKIYISKHKFKDFKAAHLNYLRKRL